MTTSTLAFILAQKSGEQTGGGIAGLLILILPMAALVYLMTVPQRKQRQKQADMLRKVEVGDEVITNGGVVGVITFVEDELFHLEVDDDVVIRVAKNAISKNLSVAESDATPSKARKGLMQGALGGAAKGDADTSENAKTSGADKSGGPSVSKKPSKGGRANKGRNA